MIFNMGGGGSAKPEGDFVWKKLTGEDGDFVGYVTSNDENMYPDGGELMGYWYERFDRATISEYGMFFDEFDDDEYPTYAMFSATNFKSNHYGSTSNTSGISLLNKAEKIEIVGETIANDAFRYVLSGLEVPCKTKIMAKSMGISSFGNWGKASAGVVNYWISKECETITTVTGGKYGPFEGNFLSNKIYCEAGSKPSGWVNGWEYYKQYYALTVMWGVTEAQFDAL